MKRSRSLADLIFLSNVDRSQGLHAVRLPVRLDNGLVGGFGQSNLTVKILAPLVTTFELGRGASNGDQGTFCSRSPSVYLLDAQVAVDNGDAGAYDGQIHLHVSPDACGGESVWNGSVCAVYDLYREGIRYDLQVRSAISTVRR